MECRICEEEFKSSRKGRVTCGDKCRDALKIANKDRYKYKSDLRDTDGPTIVFKNLFILRGAA
jgi:hypothetical protein